MVSDTSTHPNERLAIVEQKVSHMETELGKVSVKVDEMHAILLQAKGVRWAVIAVSGLVGFLAGISVMFVGPAGADVFIGSVLALRGDVYREIGAARQRLSVHSPIHFGETIVTGSCKAKIALTDGSIVSIGENTRLRFASFRNTPNDLSTRLALIVGALRLFVVKATAGGEFEIETETAVAAVRQGRARLLMKGQIATPALMHAVLDPQRGLRTGHVDPG